jgi:hypothetical protein
MNKMDTVVVWVYLVGFSIPLMGSAVVLVRSLWALLVSERLEGSGLRLVKAKPLPILFVALALFFVILVALLLVVFFTIKFVIPRYSLPFSVDMAGVLLFLLYISGFGVLYYHLAGRRGRNGVSGSGLSHSLVNMVAERVTGKASGGGEKM